MIGVLQANANVAGIVNLIVMQVAMDVSPEPTYGLRVDGDVRKNDLMAILVFLHDVRPDVIEEGCVLVELEDVMVALY